MSQFAEKKQLAIQAIWCTFFPLPMPENFFSMDDDGRYDFIESNAYEIYNEISASDLDKNIFIMISAVEDIPSI
jgi:hypothetical protein